MYIPFFPTPGPNNAASALLPMNSETPYPAALQAESRAAIQRVAEGAAAGYQAAQTVGPGMEAGLLNSTGRAFTLPTSPDLTVYQNAPQIVPLNPSGWSAPQPAMASCGAAHSPGSPWADALYRADAGGITGWAARNPALAWLAVTLGALGVSKLMKR